MHFESVMNATLSQGEQPLRSRSVTDQADGTKRWYGVTVSKPIRR